MSDNQPPKKVTMREKARGVLEALDLANGELLSTWKASNPKERSIRNALVRQNKVVREFLSIQGFLTPKLRHNYRNDVNNMREGALGVLKSINGNITSAAGIGHHLAMLNILPCSGYCPLALEH